jgi:hypothetical protein
MTGTKDYVSVNSEGKKSSEMTDIVVKETQRRNCKQQPPISQTAFS